MRGLAILLAATSAGHSAQNRIALVVGNSAYTNVPALPNPANDAADVSQSLKRLGFNVTTVTDAKFDAFRQALIEFGRAARGADMAIVFFAGHGVEAAGENWLLPVDLQMKNDLDADTEALSLRSAMLAVSNSKRLGLVILGSVDVRFGHLKVSQPGSGAKRSPNFCASARRVAATFSGPRVRA